MKKHLKIYALVLMLSALLLSGYYVNVSATDLMALLAMPEVVLYGDLNGDGEIDITDAGPPGRLPER